MTCSATGVVVKKRVSMKLITLPNMKSSMKSSTARWAVGSASRRESGPKVKPTNRPARKMPTSI